VKINENLTYTGTFSIFKYGFLSVSVAQGDTLTLTDAVRVDMPKGSLGWQTGTIALADATLAHDVVVGGTATLSDIGTMDETDEVIIGPFDQQATTATLTIAAGAVYRLDTNDGIFEDAHADQSPAIINNGLLIKAGGTTESEIGAMVLNNGTIEAALAGIDIEAITGDGLLLADPGATLFVDSSAAASLTMRFNGGDATLGLGILSEFAATISGFAPTDVIKIFVTADAATLGPGDTLVITNGGATVGILQLAGDYTGDSFHVAGGAITVTTPGAAPGAPGAGSPLPHGKTAPFLAGHRFIATMAGLAGSAGGAIHADHSMPLREPVLFKPRAMIA
jgi:hypothetical protein